MIAHCTTASVTCAGKPRPLWHTINLQWSSGWILKRTNSFSHNSSRNTHRIVLRKVVFLLLLFFDIATDAGDGFITDSEFVNLHRCFCMFSCAVLGSCTVIFTDVSAKFVDLWRLITGQTSLRPALLRSPSLLTRPPLKKEIKSQVRLILQLLCFL